ncbi:MAG: DUF4344 domain-containing metallopeptidase [Acidobacteria bacterium]|nr:DUF4344 domain-containing metallopeptidase [Acidobacteriota bacterium]
MSRNVINLLGVAAILTVITACVCNPGKNTNNSGGASPSPSASPSASPESTKSRNASENEDKGNFVVEHVDVQDPAYEKIDAAIRKNRILEDAADDLNSALSLPRDITLRSKDCGEPNAFYNPDDVSVTMCYELMDHFFETFLKSGLSEDEAFQQMFAATKFVFLHELGHALIDQYQLPITANQEDAADRCSAFINIEELGDDGVKSVLAAADAFRLESKDGGKISGGELADEHLLSEQRFFNALCMLYGSNPDKFSNIVTKGYLPKARAVRCPNEYQLNADAWSKLLKPWRKK